MSQHASGLELRWVLLPHPSSQFSFVVAKYLTHTQTRCLRHKRSSDLNFTYGTRLSFHIGQPLPLSLSSFHFLTGLFSSWKEKNKKNKTPGTKTPCFFKYSFFQIQGTISINIPIWSSLYSADIPSRKISDRLLVRSSLQLTYLTSVL